MCIYRIDECRCTLYIAAENMSQALDIALKKYLLREGINRVNSFYSDEIKHYDLNVLKSCVFVGELSGEGS